MVVICPEHLYDNEENFSSYFARYTFELSPFQKYAIEAIVKGQHVLVTAHTGSGKTLPAEFAIEHLVAQQKRVIYTAPIKALSNQKFHEFTNKFPDISFGILTGDIKHNPTATVLIMTTEILMNALQRGNDQKGIVDIDMNDVGAVVFDEVHYINDASRGKVWEETIMRLPLHIQMVMLSATMDSPETFASWCENRGERTSSHKDVYLISTHARVVPLTHYSFVTCSQSFFKQNKNKELELRAKQTIDKLHTLQTAGGSFQNSTHDNINHLLTVLRQHNCTPSNAHVLNSVTSLMFGLNMFPAICFVLNRKLLEKCAREVTTVLLEDDSKVPYTVARECEQIIRKLPNFREIMTLPEYHQMVSLLEKGIAVHHAGVMPVLREMVELLFERGFIKLLFATETFAVGINMPTKTVLFTDVSKFDGKNVRPFLPHEYTQMAGRAGRRGIDTEGFVIHLTNMFRPMDKSDVRAMMTGKPQKLCSKFKVSYQALLSNNIASEQMVAFMERSMLHQEHMAHARQHATEANHIQTKLDTLTSQMGHVPKHIVDSYLLAKKSLPYAVNSRKRAIQKQLDTIHKEYPQINKSIELMVQVNELEQQLTQTICQQNNRTHQIQENVTVALKMMQEHGFLNEDMQPTQLGVISSHFREVPCLVMATLIHERRFESLTSIEIMAILGGFAVQRMEDYDFTLSDSVEEMCIYIENMCDKFLQLETTYWLDSGTEYEYCQAFASVALQWGKSSTDDDCKEVLQTCGMFLGEFVKAMLKINNIATEMSRYYETVSNVVMLDKLAAIPALVLKFVVTNQSLYV